MTADLTGARVLVTGGAKGLGLRTAQTILAGGGAVAIADIDEGAGAEAVAALTQGRGHGCLYCSGCDRRRILGEGER